MMRIRARHYRTNELIDLTCQGGLIGTIESARATVPVDLEAGWIAPALFDLQINGCHGKAFVSPSLTAEDVALVVSKCQAHGISGLCPTLVTGSREVLTHGF